MDSKTLGKAFISVGKAMERGECSLSEESCDKIFRELSDAVSIPISKEEACSILQISRSTFDARVAEGKLPRGRKRRGFKELYWIKRDITKAQTNET